MVSKRSLSRLDAGTHFEEGVSGYIRIGIYVIYDPNDTTCGNPNLH